MNTTVKTYTAPLVLTAFAIIFIALFFNYTKEKPVVVVPTPTVVGKASLLCASGHTIDAVFKEQGSVPVVVPGQAPVPNGLVSLSLDGSQSITLSQSISADGSRYTNTEESLVFWSKGVGAMVLQNGKEVTYTNCITVKDDVGNLSQKYLDEEDKLTLRYPAGYVVDNSYTYNLSSPVVPIAGIKFAIPGTMATGTNLSQDSYLSIERRNGLNTCSASDFLTLQKGQTPTLVTDGDVSYSFASTTGAGAGNRYEEYVYALTDSHPCLAIRYFVHSTAIENHEPGKVTAYDKNALLVQFDAIRKSITLNTQLAQSVLLSADVYPLYGGLTWQAEIAGEYMTMKGYTVKANPVANVINISTVALPFEKYYAKLLVSKGWKEDISLSAGGPGSAITGYKKGDMYIVVQYVTDFSIKTNNKPEQCPCTVNFSLFSGVK